jgi:NTE family protein
LQEEAKTVDDRTGELLRYDDLLKATVDVDFVVRMERKNDIHTISNKTFDFSTTTINQLMQDGYQESKEVMKKVVAENA